MAIRGTFRYLGEGYPVEGLTVDNDYPAFEMGSGGVIHIVDDNGRLHPINYQAAYWLLLNLNVDNETVYERVEDVARFSAERRDAAKTEESQTDGTVDGPKGGEGDAGKGIGSGHVPVVERSESGEVSQPQ